MSQPELIDDDDAEMAAKKGIVVVTTACLALRRRSDAELFAKIRAAQIANLKLLHAKGVILAIGSDEVEQTSAGEVEYLRELGVFDHRSLIRMWSENTVRTIFPERPLGALREGYEASFIAVEGNPLTDLDHLKRIRFRFKQGLLLEVVSVKSAN
jgi:predicted amidohydrolase YtcJ